MLPTEVNHKSFRVQHYNKNQSDESQVNDLDQLEELREAAVIQSAKYQQALRKYLARGMSPRGFSVGDLVLRKIQTTKDRHKLSPIWEGPFGIDHVSRPGAYILKQSDGTEVPNSWNIDQLRRFHV